MARPRRQADKAEPAKDRAHGPLRHPDAEAPLNYVAEVDPTPADHPIRLRVRSRLDDDRKFTHLLGAEPRRPPRKRPIEEASQPFGIVAVNPVAQRLPIHATALCRLRPAPSVEYQRQRKHPARRLCVPRPRRFAPQIRSRKVRACDFHCHPDPPPSRKEVNQRPAAKQTVFRVSASCRWYKILALTDALGNSVDFRLLPGQAHDLREVSELIDTLCADHLLADRAFDADWFRSALVDREIAPVIPPKSNRRFPADFDKATYKWRHLIENFFGKLKENRGISLRSCKTNQSFTAFIALASALILLR